MSANNAINLDAFDDEDPHPIVLSFTPVEIKDQESLKMVLEAKKRTELLRALRKIVLGVLATSITLVLALT